MTPQKHSLVQTQANLQTQTLSPQQILLVRLLELPISELEQRVRSEVDNNEALEETGFGEDLQAESFDDDRTEADRSESALDTILNDYRSADDVPDYLMPHGTSESNGAEGIDYAAPISFHDILEQQLGEQQLEPRQVELLHYLIGSLDDDGLLKKSLSYIAEELYIDFSIEATQAELESMLSVLQTFEPAGIGARDLQECLLIQLRQQPPSALCHLCIDILTRCYDDLIHHRWEKITQRLSIDRTSLDRAYAHIRTLNPKPGAAVGDNGSGKAMHIIPDFVVETTDDGIVTFSLNEEHVPHLRVSSIYTDMMKDYSEKKMKMNRLEKEALAYTKLKVDKAQGFIDAIRQRHRTLESVMQAIIEMQCTYFQTGDEGQLNPMILKDVAERTGLDISTISRVSGSKYVQTNYGILPLRFFFSDGYTTAAGEEISTRQIRQLLKERIESEDRLAPFSDDVLSHYLKEKGFPIARRTVAKYREQMGIPVARLRK